MFPPGWRQGMAGEYDAPFVRQPCRALKRFTTAVLLAALVLADSAAQKAVVSPRPQISPGVLT
jgi:hypothetical protein